VPKSDPQDWKAWKKRIIDLSERKKAAQTEPVSKAEAIEALWRKGVIAPMKLDSTQKEIYDKFHESTDRKFVLNCSRRLGKSYLCAVIAIEFCLKKPRAQVRYAAPTARMVKKILIPLMREILLDCPKDIKPRFNSQEQIWYFPSNGSELHLAGTDKGNAENLRGTGLDLGFVDEAGFVDDLQYVVGDVLMPQTLTTGGRLMLASTPPPSPDHAFIAYIAEAKASGNYVHKTIFDNPRLTKAVISECIKEAGGDGTTTFRREFLAEIITDTELAIIPEFTLRKQGKIIKEVDRPEYFDAYVAMDIGFVDFTAVVFGYWDFGRARLVIEDEYLTNRSTTTDLKQGIFAKEDRLWENIPKRDILRTVDASPQVLAELNSGTNGRFFSPAKKDQKMAAINSLRLAIGDEKVLIHPRCKNLISHLANGIWNSNKTKFARTSNHGHFDFIDALLYMWRTVDRSKNPYPQHTALGPNQIRIRHETDKPSTAFLKKMFNNGR